mmetsp:Transcript_926/g.1401  ORF Transcript_926/g.1401 Transcript_926/m.1401 type:complete len:306 (-) Transcript_926:11-928(-)
MEESVSERLKLEDWKELILLGNNIFVGIGLGLVTFAKPGVMANPAILVLEVAAAAAAASAAAARVLRRNSSSSSISESSSSSCSSSSKASAIIFGSTTFDNSFCVVEFVLFFPWTEGDAEEEGEFAHCFFLWLFNLDFQNIHILPLFFTLSGSLGSLFSNTLIFVSSSMSSIPPKRFRKRSALRSSIFRSFRSRRPSFSLSFDNFPLPFLLFLLLFLPGQMTLKECNENKKYTTMHMAAGELILQSKYKLDTEAVAPAMRMLSNCPISKTFPWATVRCTPCAMVATVAAMLYSAKLTDWSFIFLR